MRGRVRGSFIPWHIQYVHPRLPPASTYTTPRTDKENLKNHLILLWNGEKKELLTNVISNNYDNYPDNNYTFTVIV